jgi:5'-nucleotidase
MKILISNDDGYQAEGLVALAEKLTQIADVTVVAPSTNRSCASSALTVRQSIAVKKAENGMFYVEGTPGDCVHLAINGMLDFEPDMVVSGINNGSNLGDDVIYSGTVAAAIEGRFLGLPAIAVSLVGEKLSHYDTAARVAYELVKTLEHTPLQRDTILNINVPDIPWEQLSGIEATRCGARHQSQPIIPLGSSEDSEFFQIGPAGNEADAGPGTDFYAVANNKVSVTPLQIDMTRYSRMPEIAKWITAVEV